MKPNQSKVQGGLVGVVALCGVLLSGCAPTMERGSCCDEPTVADKTSPGFSDDRTARQIPAGSDATPALADGKLSNDLFVTAWRDPSERLALPLTHRVTRHDGREVQLRQLVGQPLVVSFAYTHCTNPNKCQSVVRRMAELRGRLEHDGLLGKVRLAVITYDAQRDTPEVMRNYSRTNGLELDERALFLRPSVDPEHRLYSDLNVTASFNPNGVALHGVQLLLLDKAGRLARTYRVVAWDNARVVDDLRRLTEE